MAESDEVIMYNTALPADEIKKHADAWWSKQIAELEAEIHRLRVEKQALRDALDWIGLRARTALYDSVSEVHNIDG